MCNILELLKNYKEEGILYIFGLFNTTQNNYVYESVVFYCVYFAWQNGYQLCSLWLYKQNGKRVWNIIPSFSSTKTLIFCTNGFELSEGKQWNHIQDPFFILFIQPKATQLVTILSSKINTIKNNTLINIIILCSVK